VAEQYKASIRPTPEQLLYAKILEVGMLIGLAILVITFFLYVFGALEPYVPLDQVPQHWSKSVHEYTHDLDIKTGWGWVSMVGHGDFLNFVGVALLAGVSIFCYLAIIPGLVRNKDHVYAGLAVLEVVVLTLAASGILGAGGH
jgi:hypothetical protein